MCKSGFNIVVSAVLYNATVYYYNFTERKNYCELDIKVFVRVSYIIMF